MVMFGPLTIQASPQNQEQQGFFVAKLEQNNKKNCGGWVWWNRGYCGTVTIMLIAVFQIEHTVSRIREVDACVQVECTVSLCWHSCSRWSAWPQVWCARWPQLHTGAEVLCAGADTGRQWQPDQLNRVLSEWLRVLWRCRLNNHLKGTSKKCRIFHKNTCMSKVTLFTMAQSGNNSGNHKTTLKLLFCFF